MTDVEQLAMFMQARDVRTFGVVRDGIAHPTWDESDDAAREEYFADAGAIVKAMQVLGWEKR